MRVSYAEEIKPKPEPDVLSYIFENNNLLRKDVIIIGASAVDEEFAACGGTDYININGFL